MRLNMDKSKSQFGYKGSLKRWEKKRNILADLKKIATKEQFKYVEKLREKSLFAVAEIILGLSKI